MTGASALRESEKIVCVSVYGAEKPMISPVFAIGPSVVHVAPASMLRSSEPRLVRNRTPSGASDGDDQSLSGVNALASLHVRPTASQRRRP